MKDKGNDQSVPIVMYVDRISFEPQITADRRDTILDIEIDGIDLAALVLALQNRLENKLPGTIRIRLHGKIVL
jgi:hypothetical protein